MAKRGSWSEMAGHITADLKSIDSMLGELDEVMRSKSMKKAVKRAGLVVAKRYKETAPRGKTGNLQASIPTRVGQIRVYQTADEKVTGAVVKMASPTGNHAHLVEFGHRIRARGKKGQGPGQWLGRSTDPGRQLERAAEDTQVQQTEAIVTSLAKDITKQENERA